MFHEYLGPNMHAGEQIVRQATTACWEMGVSCRRFGFFWVFVLWCSRKVLKLIFGICQNRWVRMESYFVTIRLKPSKAWDFWKAFEQLPAEPIEGVKLKSSYSMFGKWDIAIWFEADTNEKALDFVGEKLRAMEGVLETRTKPMVLIQEYKKH